MQAVFSIYCLFEVDKKTGMQSADENEVDWREA